MIRNINWHTHCFPVRQSMTPGGLIVSNAGRVQSKLGLDDYNFKHFRTKYIVADAIGTIRRSGVQPGEFAPEFTLPTANGGTLSLSDLRDKPVLLRFGSTT